jgi:hypothetical protein
LLGLLVERQGELISKDEIMQAVWPQTVVEENNLTSRSRPCVVFSIGTGLTAAASKRCLDAAIGLSRQ